MPRAMQYSKGSIIYFSGDKSEHVFVLQKGSVLLTGSDIATGSPVTEQIAPGGFFGIKSTLGHFPREETATVLADSVAILMTFTEFEGIFMSNKPLIMKMLQVFSAQLRTLQHKTEAILKSNTNMDQASGLLDVAKSFYNEEEFKAAAEVCNRLINSFPHTPNAAEAQTLLKNATLRAGQEPPRKPITFQSTTEGTESFMNSAFDRFVKKYSAGEVIIAEYDQGETFYLLRSGVVQSVKCVNGGKTTLGQLKPGEFFGEMAILENSPRTASCLAMSDVEVLEFNKENFELLITGNPQMALMLLKIFCRRIYDTQRRFRILCISDISIRIADVFLMFDERNPESAADMSKSRSFDLSIQEVAHWAAVPLDAAKSELSRFAEKHRVEIFDERIVVSNIADFRRMVESQWVTRPGQR